MIAEEIKYFILIISVLLVPKIFMRFRVPSGITAIAMGLLTSYYLGWFLDSQTVVILATLGITSLFLFAGLEIDLYELKKDAPVLIKHIIMSAMIIAICSAGLRWALNLETRVAVILSLGLTTPSTGFILNSINSFQFTESQKYWIRSKAIANEILALLILFFALQSQSLTKLGVSLGTLLLMVILLPLAFRVFIKVIAPFAKNSEVTFMILMGFVCGVITMKLGTYYLIGAFIAGVVAAQFRHFIKTENSEKMLYSISFFSSLLIPFYFFKAGLKLDITLISLNSILYGIAFLIFFVPLRYANVFLSIKLFLPECWNSRYQISLSLMPTLIFGLVIASILKEKLGVSLDIVNGVIIYTVFSSIIPSLLLKGAPAEEYDARFL